MKAARRKPAHAAHIRLLALDVDGVLTDGRLYYGPRGEMLKVFHVRDGFGIRAVQKAGIEVAVISGRRSTMVGRRCRDLGIKHVSQGDDDKLPILKGLLKRLNITAAQCAFIGDDINDIGILKLAGFPICPMDAPAYVKKFSEMITKAKGGEGVVREVGDLLLAARGALSKIAG